MKEKAAMKGTYEKQVTALQDEITRLKSVDSESCTDEKIVSFCELRSYQSSCKNMVRTKLENPWKSLNLKTTIQGLESPWIYKEVLESPWILLTLVFCDIFYNFNSFFVTFYCFLKPSFQPIGPWISWYMALKVLEKALNFTLPDMYEPW